MMLGIVIGAVVGFSMDSVIIGIASTFIWWTVMLYDARVKN